MAFESFKKFMGVGAIVAAGAMAGAGMEGSAQAASKDKSHEVQEGEAKVAQKRIDVIEHIMQSAHPSKEKEQKFRSTVTKGVDDTLKKFEHESVQKRIAALSAFEESVLSPKAESKDAKADGTKQPGEAKETKAPAEKHHELKTTTSDGVSLFIDYTISAEGFKYEGAVRGFKGAPSCLKDGVYPTMPKDELDEGMWRDGMDDDAKEIYVETRVLEKMDASSSDFKLLSEQSAKLRKAFDAKYHVTFTMPK